MDYNSIQPDDKTLRSWAMMTEDNKHRKVRVEIGRWAFDNCKSDTIALVIKTCFTRISDIYLMAEETGSFSDDYSLEEACRLTNLMLDAIGNEFGRSTQGLIASTL